MSNKIISSKLENNIELIRFDGLEKFNALIAEEVRDQLIKFFDSPNSKVIIDLEGIKYIDSSGFGCFLSTMKASRNNYGIMKICCPDSDVKNIFVSLQLHTVFEIYDDLNICIASFQP